MLNRIAVWRSQSFAILPLAFLVAFGIDLSKLAIIYFLRAIHCEEYKAEHTETPLDNVCRLPDVQRAYSRDLSIYLAISTILNIVVAGSYGRLSDTRGRKRALSVAVAMTAMGDAWLGLTALNTPLRAAWSVQIAAVFKGLGGGFAIMNSVHSALVADTSAMSARSFHMGLLWIMYWMGAAVSPLVSAYFMERDLYVQNFALAAVTWVVYLLYAWFSLPETVPVVTDDTVHAEVRKGHTMWPDVRVVMRDMWKLMPLIFGHPILRWLGVVSATTLLGAGAFLLEVPYFDGKFGLSPQQAALINAVVYVSKAFTVLCLLPLFLAFYRWYISGEPTSRILNESRTQYDFLPDDPGEDAILLEETTTPADTEAMDAAAREATAAQELVICRTSFLLEAFGVVLTWRSTNVTQVALASLVCALGAAAGPSLSSLVTLAAAPEEMGRILAGKSALESAALAVRSPFFYALYDATLDAAPGAIWLCAAAMLVVCAAVVTGLRPRQFRAAA